jgi:AbrB family looped-hinge helix DNA binding protein
MNVRVTSNGRITIPTSLREKYGIKAGTRIILTETDDGIALKPVTADTISNCRAL